MKNEIRYLYTLAAVVFLTGIGLLIWFGAGAFLGRLTAAQRATFDSIPALPAARPCDYHRHVDGVCVESALGVDPELVAVMIENSREAWPLTGLARAAVVYEAPVEGNVPRFLAIYVEDDRVDQAGPVRSVRPYYVDWVSEYGNIMYLHVGGSDEGLERLDAADIFDINEFYRGGYFWRSADRSRPHNTYTSSELWQKARRDYGEFYKKDEAVDGWLFAARAPCGSASDSNVNEECVSEITVAFLSPTYDARWVYSTSTEKYARYQNKKLQTDADGAAIMADTVIVQRVRAAVIDEVGRKRIETMGKGEATVFRNGYALKGEWRKASRQDRTQFYDENDQLIPLQPGKIWVEVVPQSVRVETVSFKH